MPNNETMPEWFTDLIIAGIGRLTAARLNFRPMTKSETALTTREWAQNIWEALHPSESQGLNIKKCFGVLATEKKNWPTIAEFIEEWSRIAEAAQVSSTMLALPAPPISPEEQARKQAKIDAARRRFFDKVRNLPDAPRSAWLRESAEIILKRLEKANASS